VTTISDLLDEYTRIARETREKGLLLERLTRAFRIVKALPPLRYAVPAGHEPSVAAEGERQPTQVTT
jgi:hypothetical protein